MKISSRIEDDTQQKRCDERGPRFADVVVAQERLAQIGNHLGGSPDSGSSSAGKKGKSSLLEKHADDVSICSIFYHSHMRSMLSMPVARHMENY